MPRSRPLKIFTDGATRFNGQPNAKGGWGVVCPFDRDLDCYGYCTSGQQTNNRYELEAIKRAQKIIMDYEGRRRFQIHTDSQYAIGALCDWIEKWRENGWVTNKGKDVKNRALIEYIDDTMDYLDSIGKRVELVHVRGHQSNDFNNEADRLAKLGAEENNVHELDYDYDYYDF